MDLTFETNDHNQMFCAGKVTAAGLATLVNKKINTNVVSNGLMI